jgi:hypothetical protein
MPNPPLTQIFKSLFMGAFMFVCGWSFYIGGWAIFGEVVR